MFYVGQKVVCVDDRPSRRGDEPLIQVGEVYTVHDIVEDFIGQPGILIAEIECPAGYLGWHADRFRPAIERKTDISVFADILNRVNQKTPEKV